MGLKAVNIYLPTGIILVSIGTQETKVVVVGERIQRRAIKGIGSARTIDNSAM